MSSDKVNQIFRKSIKWLILAVMAALLFIVGCNLWIISGSKGKTFDDANKIPENDVALVLGTSKQVQGGNPNLFFHYRIKAAAELYQAGKVKHFILSGDNRTKWYDEPNDMRSALIKEGVPADAITLDYAGFRTLDSVVRSKKIFGQDKLTIVSQQFHNQRALFIAKCYGIDAIAYNANDVATSSHLKVMLREVFAKTLAVIDLYILKKEPKFLGDPVEILVE